MFHSMLHTTTAMKPDLLLPLNTDSEEADPDLTAAVVVEKIASVDLVRVEKSLHSLGFFASTANRELSRTVVQVIRRPDGQKIQAKAVIEGIQSLGLPTTADRDKYMALMKIALDQRDEEGQLMNPVRFTGSDMIKLLRLRKGGFHYDEINDWCKRMVATTIMSEASIFLADRRQFATDTFHVFDRVVLVGEQIHDGNRSEHYQVYLSHWQLTNLNEGFMLPLDFNAYLKLGRDIAKALFGHLSVWFYASRGEAVEKRYTDLCQLLNIRAYPHVSKARSVLAPSLDELVEIGYLSDWELAKTTGGEDFKLILSPGNRLMSLEHFASVANPDARAEIEARSPGWVQELIARGVTERRARQLVLDVAETQAVMDQIEYVEHLIQQDSKSRRKIINPAGFYIWAIESNISVPDDFETARKRRVRQASAGAARGDGDAEMRALRLRQEYDEFCHFEVRRKIETAYTEEQRSAAVRDELKVVRKEQPEWFQRMSETMRKDLAMSRIRTKVREGLDLPSFERWSKLELQQRLF